MKAYLTLITLIAPGIVSAEAPISNTLQGFVDFLVWMSTKILPLLIIGALILFLFGIAKRVFFSGDGFSSSANYIGTGIAALFVMVSVWGLVNVLRNTFKLNNEVTPEAPRIIRPESTVNTVPVKTDSGPASVAPSDLNLR